MGERVKFFSPESTHPLIELQSARFKMPLNIDTDLILKKYLERGPAISIARAKR